uniref:Uncharacterized protein n=1 Tax=Leersia perrieri TaxID=77586 RepID=A0A0D9WT73_9ORYZ
MYGPDGTLGKTHGLLPHYDILNKLFRYSIGTKGGDYSTIQGFSRDLLYYCRSGKPKISIIYYIWDEMQLTANDARRAPWFPCSFLHSCSYLSSIIFVFLILPYPALSAIFSVCTVNATLIHENAVKIRKIENRQKAFLCSQHVDVSDDDTREIPPPCFEDPFGDDGAGSSAAGSSAARGSMSHFFGFDPSTAFHENSGVTDAAAQGKESSEESGDAEESDDDGA